MYLDDVVFGDYNENLFRLLQVLTEVKKECSSGLKSNFDVNSLFTD